MYDELIAELRMHHCDAKEDDTQEVCEECAYDVIIADKSVPNGFASVCVCGLMHRAADAIEEQQAAEKKYLSNISALETENQHLKRERYWIPVTERLPKEEETVLAFGTLGVAWLDWRHDNKWCCYGGVTHWMPLPTPPTAEEGE